jgi:nucleoside 2-deoxyribosyltransferase
MKIYFAASITGGRDDAPMYAQIVELLRQHGTVVSEHIGLETLTSEGETGLDDTFIHDRDLEWVEMCDALVAEVTQPSTGTGYEIGRAVAWRKPVLCLYRAVDGRTLTRMISGNGAVSVREYMAVQDVAPILDAFFAQLRSSVDHVNT